jgi:hypothetical protein
MVINRVGPLSCAKIAGALYAAIGLIIGAFVSLAAMAGAFGSEDMGGGMMSALFGVGAIVLLPIFYGCMGFIGAAISAWLYNLIAGAVGGVEVDIR